MLTIIGLIVSHTVVAVLAAFWGKRHPSTLATVASDAAAVQTAASAVTNGKL